MSKLMETLGEIERRYNELDEPFADPAIATDPHRFAVSHISSITYSSTTETIRYWPEP